MQSYYIMLLIIISNNILLNLPIVFTYTLFLLVHFPNISDLIYLLLRIGFFILHY